MTRAWITNSSTTLEAMINPITAACQEGFTPTDLYFLENPGVSEEIEQAITIGSTIIQEYGGDEPEIHITELDSDRQFDRVLSHYVDGITAVQEGDGEVAVDITPGRKYMSAIAFAAGIEYDADHVFYFYLGSRDLHGQCYPDMARSATRLYDFTEEL